MAAVISVLLVVFIFYQCVRGGAGRGTPSGRTAAYLGTALAVLLIIGVKDSHAATALVAGFIGGISDAVSGLINFFSRF
jgi:hypothetical protein